jgi:hypothetical protein
MINWIKSLFKKSTEVVSEAVTEVRVKIKEKVLTDREKHLLYLLEREGKYTDWKDKKVYLGDGSYHQVLGYYSYYDIETTKQGYVLKDLRTGNITEYTLGWFGGNLFFNNKPHTWFNLLEYDDKRKYHDDVKHLTDDELFDKYYNRLPIDVKRELKLKELGI